MSAKPLTRFESRSNQIMLKSTPNMRIDDMNLRTRKEIVFVEMIDCVSLNTSHNRFGFRRCFGFPIALTISHTETPHKSGDDSYSKQETSISC